MSEETQSKSNLEAIREFLKFFGDEFANLDDKALEFLEGVDIFKNQGEGGLLDQQKLLTAEQREQLEKERQEKINLQRELFARLEQMSKQKQQYKAPQRTNDLAEILTELCQLDIKGFSEKVLCLTEVFLPPLNNPYREYIDAYNRDKMPSLRNSMDQRQIEQRKRTIKEEMKTANDKLKHEARRPKLTPMQKANIRYLLSEKLNQSHIEKMLDRRHENCSHIQKIQLPDLESEIKSKKKLAGKSLLGPRLYSKIEYGDKNENFQTKNGTQNEKQSKALEDNNQQLVGTLAEPQKSRAISIDPKSVIMQKVAQNLAEAQKIEQMGIDKEEEKFKQHLASEVAILNKKFQEKRQKLDQPNFDPFSDSILKAYFTEKDRHVLKCAFSQNHQNEMMKRFPPIPAFVMTETEKVCFNFVKSIDFKSGYYSINGKPSLQKSHFIDNHSQKFIAPGHGINEQQNKQKSFVGPEYDIHLVFQSSKTGQQDANQQHLKDVLKNSLFGAFLNPDGASQAKAQQQDENKQDLKQTLENGMFFGNIDQKEDEQIIMSQSVHSQEDDNNDLEENQQQLWSDQDNRHDSSSSSEDPLLFDEGSAKKFKKMQAKQIQSNHSKSKQQAVQNKVSKSKQLEKIDDKSCPQIEIGKDVDLFDKKKELSADLQKYQCKTTLSDEVYNQATGEYQIRQTIVKQKFDLLNQKNSNFKIQARRSQFWGELKDSYSQFQIDKDYYQYNYFESLMPKQVVQIEPYFFVEPLNAANMPGKNKEKETSGPGLIVPFVTKYGSLNLSGAHVNNFKIDDIQEYEFVQRQRAYLYDPLHIKGSTQLKSFSSQVGYGSTLIHTQDDYNNQKQKSQTQQICLQKTFDKQLAIQNQCQNIWKPEQMRLNDSTRISLGTNSLLEQAPAIKQVLEALNENKNEQADTNEVLIQATKDNLQIQFNTTHLDIRKQKQLRIHSHIVKNLTDDFDQLTKNVRVKKLEELIKRQQDELIEKSENQKKNPTPAYIDKFGWSFQNPKIFPQTGLKNVNESSQQQAADAINQSHEKGQNGDQIISSREHSIGSLEIESQQHSSRSNDKNQINDRQKLAGQDDLNMQILDKEDEEQKNQIADDISLTSNEDQVFLEDLHDVNTAQKASHAECILNLSFTKFKWNLDGDFSRFHRPDIQHQINQEREQIRNNKEQELLRNENQPLGQNGPNLSIHQMRNMNLNYPEQVQKKLEKIRKENIMVEIPLTIVDRETIKRRNKRKGFINANEYFNDRIKLSLKDGKFCIFEHIDENPIYINNFGMVSQLTRYVYNDKNQILPNKEFLPSSQNVKLKHMGPYGQQIQAKAKLPLLGNVAKENFSGISILSNKMYHAPVFFHKPEHTDFFCSYFTDKEGSKHIYLREIYSVYSVGQIEPIQPVYNPQSRQYHTYIKQHSQAYILRFLQENNNYLDFREIQRLFFHLTDQMLKKFIKEIQVDVNKDQVCKSQQQLSDEYIKQLITPEMVCQFESALYGEAMLRMRGIKSITNAEKISYASNKYCSEQRDPIRQKISKFIENEVLCTPWNLSQNFCTINRNHSGMLMIMGVGDPSNNNGGFSFLKMPLKISNDSPIDCIDIRVNLNPAIQNPKSVTGTDADLRKLKKEDIYKKLVNEFKYPKNQIQGMSRWNMVGLLRQISSSLQTSALDDKNKRYARGIRYTSKTQREVYHKQVDQIFKTQMMYLSGSTGLHDDSDYEDPCEALNIPARHRQDQHAINSDGDHDSVDAFNQQDGVKKFIIEISDKLKIQEICEERSPQFGGGYPYPLAPSSGSIRNIQDIPNFKKLLIATVSNQTQTMQTGQQIGLGSSVMHIGGNSTNQSENANNQKNAEQILEEKIQSGSITYKCEVLKKIIRNEDDNNLVERIEFSSDPKVIKKFRKRQEKCKKKLHRQKKIGMREKINIRQSEMFPGQPFGSNNQGPGASMLNSQSSLNIGLSQNQIGISSTNQSQNINPLGNQFNPIDSKSGQLNFDFSSMSNRNQTQNQGSGRQYIGIIDKSKDSSNSNNLIQLGNQMQNHYQNDAGANSLQISLADQSGIQVNDDDMIPLFNQQAPADSKNTKKSTNQKHVKKIMDLDKVGKDKKIDDILAMQIDSNKQLDSNPVSNSFPINGMNQSKSNEREFKKPTSNLSNQIGGSVIQIGNVMNKGAKNKSNRSSKALKSNDDISSINMDVSKGEDIQINNPQPFLDISSIDVPPHISSAQVKKEADPNDQDASLVIQVADDMTQKQKVYNINEEQKMPELSVPLGRPQDVDMSYDQGISRTHQNQFEDDEIQMSSNIQFDSCSRQSKSSANRSNLYVPKNNNIDFIDYQGNRSAKKPSKSSKKDRSKSAKAKSSDKFAPQKANQAPAPQKIAPSQMTPDERVMHSVMKDQESTMKANKKLSTSRRAKKSGESILNNLIEQIIEICIQKDNQLIFRYDVDKKIAPGYYNFIQKPICLEKMKQKAKREEYATIDAFKDDMALLRDNAERFNGPNNFISALARDLEQTALNCITSTEYSEQIEAAMINIIKYQFD